MNESIGARRERTRRDGKCQLCESEVPLGEQYILTNDLTKGLVVKRKNAERKGAEKASHYCSACAKRRVKQKQAWLDARSRRLAKEST